jgi:hypothetical protein
MSITETKMMNLHSIDSGYCRVMYKYNKRLYCLQDEGRSGGVVFYTCSRDGEPDSPISTNGYVFDLPPEHGPEDSIENTVRSFLLRNNLTLEKAL